MKTRRNLYLLSGIVNCLFGGFVTFVCLLILLLGKVVRTMFETSYELVEGFINGLVETDSSYDYLLDLSKEQAIDYIMRITNTIFVVLLIIAVITIILGVVNIKLRNSHARFFAGKVSRKVLFIIATWLITGINIISAVATTVAVFLKVNDDSNLQLYKNEYNKIT